ncbi:unnamed protein product [Chrysoparadoxa australica]
MSLGATAREAFRFARRHRRSLALAGLAGVAAAGYWRVKKALQDKQDLDAILMTRAREEARFRQYALRSRSECLAAIVTFLPTLKKKLFAMVDVTGPVKELKVPWGQLAVGTLELSAQFSLLPPYIGAAKRSCGKRSMLPSSFQIAPPPLTSCPLPLAVQVKVSGLTRLLTALYAFNTLNLMLALQLHILGRCSFEESCELLRGLAGEMFHSCTPLFELAASVCALTCLCYLWPGRDGECKQGLEGEGESINGLQSSMEERHVLLSSTYEYLLGEGLEALARDVEQAVRRSSKDWSCQTKMDVTCGGFTALLQRIRADLEGQGPGLLQYAINPAQVSSVGGDLQKVQGMLDETWDAAESPNFAFALADSITATFDALCRRIRERIFEGEAMGPESDRFRGQVALASAISSLKPLVGELLEGREGNPYIVMSSSLPTVRGLCSEAFGHFKATIPEHSNPA